MFSFSGLKQKRYTAVAKYQNEDQAEKALMGDGSSISSSSSENLPTHTSTASRWPYRLSLAANALLLSSIALLFANSYSNRPTQSHDKFNNTLIKQVSMPSPILDQIHVELSTVRRNGSLLPDHPTSIYRQDPSHEVDMAWHRLGNINPIPISVQDVRNIGYDPSIAAKWPEVYGLGGDAYVARLDVFHEIHCLDMLRREVHFEHYYPQWPNGATADHKVHISHCIYALLQSLTCAANTDPFIHYWVDVGDEPYPDFSINRQCKNFDAILDWQEKNSIPMSQFRDVIRKPEGVAPRIMSEEYKYMVGLINEEPKLKSAQHKAWPPADGWESVTTDESITP
jgi:hypothetical protein